MLPQALEATPLFHGHPAEPEHGAQQLPVHHAQPTQAKHPASHGTHIRRIVGVVAVRLDRLRRDVEGRRHAACEHADAGPPQGFGLQVAQQEVGGPKCAVRATDHHHASRLPGVI